VSNWANKRDVGRLTGRPWRRLREQVLKRDNYLCQCAECATRLVPLAADEVDHVIPLSRGGTNHPDNLRAINSEHHRLKSQTESGAGSSRVAIGPDGWPVSARMAARKPGGHWER
jgi:5-methylcytosine-specific restriction protein A